MKYATHLIDNKNNVELKRPFAKQTVWIIGLLIFCAAWIGTIAAAGIPPIEPDVSVPPAPVDPPETQSHQVTAPQQVDMGEEMIYLPMILSPGSCGLSSEETAVANYAMNHPDQGRTVMQCDSTLAQVARAKAEDMAARCYFGHVDPDGIGPNYKTRAAGYDLPTWYSTSIEGNNIESIAAGYATPEAAWNAWLNSAGHRTHVLAESSFWADQTNYGIGYYYDANSPYRHYWVFISAPPE